MAHGLKLQLNDLYDAALSVHESRGLKREASDIRKDLSDFFALRVKNVLSEQGVRYDVVDAVMASGFADLKSTIERAAVVQALAASDDRTEFKMTVEQFNRVSNLGSKATARAVDPALFAEQVETELYEKWLQQRPTFMRRLKMEILPKLYKPYHH